jgi:hypothetical protein
MSPQKSIAVIISGVIIVGSLILPRIGFKNSVISLKSTAVLSGIGVGIGNGLFIFYSISNRDFIGSLFTAIITALVVGATVFLYFGKRES